MPLRAREGSGARVKMILPALTAVRGDAQTPGGDVDGSCEPVTVRGPGR